MDGESADFEDVDYTDETTAVTAHFLGFESELCGGISSYEWAVGEGNQGRERESVMPFTTQGIVAGANGTGYAQANFPNLDSFGSQRLFVTVRGITGCEDVLESTSNGFVIDSTPPSLKIIKSGPNAVEEAQSNGVSNVSTDGEYQIVAGYSSVWTVSDEGSGESDEASLDVGTYPGGRNILDGSTVSENYIRDQITSVDGVAIYVTVTVTNGAGVESTKTGNRVVRDTTPPFTGEVG